MRKVKMLVEAVIFLLLVAILRLTIEIGLSKQAATSLFMKASSSWMIDIVPGHPIWICMAEIGPIIALILLASLLYKTIVNISCHGIWQFVVMGTLSSYMLIALHWGSESSIPVIALLLQRIGRNYIPRIIYAIGLGQLLLLTFGKCFDEDKAVYCRRSLVLKTLAILSALSSTIITLSGKQGSWVALAFLIGGYCIKSLDRIEENAIDGGIGSFTLSPLAVTQWHLLAVCLFFATGHWCAFDGLRYGAAFIGFDEFILVRQAILLTIDTFGFSLFLPVFGLPLLASGQYLSDKTDHRRSPLFVQLYQMYMMYGFIVATAVTATIICVAIQRRHLMVWGLFAPKFVFDVVGLILTDVLICLALLFFS
uniref:GPI ethanolamine phosphate transferase 3 isoform X2 n=2 Tax=Rhizophora mucronata TaxID=61149 RepID=A0A2P2LDP1_RHIMU